MPFVAIVDNGLSRGGYLLNASATHKIGFQRFKVLKVESPQLLAWDIETKFLDIARLPIDL